MTKPNRRLSLEEVLDEFFFSAGKPNPDAVVRACEAHPEYRDDIVEFAALWTSYEASPEPIEDKESLSQVTPEDVLRLQSVVLSKLHELDSRAAPDVDVQAARAAIKTLVGGKLPRAAAALDFGNCVLLLTKVLTTITDVPQKVLRDLAQHLKVAPAGLKPCLGPQLAGSRSYKSAQAPDAPVTETWKSAVLSLPVSEEEKKRLLAFQTDEEAP
jgi:hypothetical protein